MPAVIHLLKLALPHLRALFTRYGAPFALGVVFALVMRGAAGSGGERVGHVEAAGSLRFLISFPAARSAHPLDGRVMLFISDGGKTEPRLQSDQYRAGSTRPIFGVDVDGLGPGVPAVIDGSVWGWPVGSASAIPPGDYWVQAMLVRYETFTRSDGHVVKLPIDRGEGQHWATKPGNLYSKAAKMRVDPEAGGDIAIALDQEVPPVSPPTDSKQVKYLRVQNERLTKFWGQPMYLGAIVLLPYGWDTHPDAHYPLLIHHGHFPASMANDNWRETEPDAEAENAERQRQEAGYRFYPMRSTAPGRCVPIRLISVPIAP